MRKIISILALCPTLYFGQIVDMATGGQSISITETPYQVALFDYDGLSCGGSILNEKWVLTAAHCSRAPISKIKVGITNLNDTGQEVKIKKIIKHPNYNDYTNDNDIALIELAENIIFNQRVQPIRLVQTSDNLYNIGRSVSVSGWGWRYPNTGQPAQQLQKVDVPIISNSLANSQLDITYSLHPNLTSNMIATGAVNDNRKGTCHGDSGGPLVTNDDNGKLKQIGIVSWGVPKCLGGKNSPSIYTKVSNYLDWIYQYVPNPIAIAGSPNVCQNQNVTYTLTGNDNANVQWVASEGINIQGNSNESITITPKANFNGLATIKAIVDNKEVAHKIWVGKPKVKIKVRPETFGVFLNVKSLVDGVSVLEQGISDNNILWHNITLNQQDTGSSYFTRIDNQHSEKIDVTVSNICGSESFNKSVMRKCDESVALSIGSTPDEYTLFPINPCVPSDMIGDIYHSKSSDYTIQISNATGQVVLTTHNKKFSLAHLLPGTYYARIIKNGKIVHTQTLLKR